MVIKQNPRRTNSTRRNKLRERVKHEGRPCALCGLPIDYTLPAGHEMSYELDEIVPVSLGGDPYDYNNVQPTHRKRNRMKGNGKKKKKGSINKIENSRQWY